MSNKDIIESVGLEYVHQSYEKPMRKGEKPRLPFKVKDEEAEKDAAGDDEHASAGHGSSVAVPLDS